MSFPAAEGFDPSEADMLLIKVMSPVFGFPRDLTFRMLATSTIKDVKDKITGSLDSRPPCDQQRLIYRGKMMQDENRLATVLGLNSGLVGSDPKEAFTFHLMLRPPPNPAPAPASVATPTAQNALPNASTLHTRSGPATPMFGEQAPEENTAHTRLGELSRPGLQRLEGLQRQLRQRQEHLNLRLGSDQASSSGVSTPGASNDPAPGLGINTTPTLTRTLAADTSNGSSNSGPVLGPSWGPPRSHSEAAAPNQGRVRQRHAHERLRERLLHREDTTTAVFTGLPPPEPLPVFHLPTNNPHPITRASPVYLLQDASGRPRALLLGPPRSANPTLAEIINGLRGPLEPPGVGIPDLHGLGLPPPPDPANLGAMGGIAGNNLLGAGLGLGDHFGGAHAHHRVAFHGAVLERPRRAGRLNLADLIRGVRAHASHFWLAIRLAVFVVLFTGSGGWRRMLYLGSIAVAIFIWQTGVLEPFLRPVIDAINPPPPPPPQPPTPTPTPTQQAPNQPQPQAAAGNLNNDNPPPGHAVDTNVNQPDPARTAQMLVDRQQDRFRDIFRSIERCIMIFLASLIPGLHERHVNAVEQRQRDEAQRQQLLEQQRQQQLAAAGNSGDMEADNGDEGGGAGAGQVPPPAPQPEPQMDEVDVDPLVVL